MVSLLLDGEFWAAAIRISTPLILAAMGALVCERSGVMNITTDGILLVGAFAASVGAYITDSIWTGVLVAAVAGGLFGIAFSLVTVTLKGDQVVGGLSMNLAAYGLLVFLYYMFLFKPGSQIQTQPFPQVAIPYLSELPGVGVLLFQQHPLFYVAIGAVVVVSFFLYRTHLGLIVRSVGENAKAANALGIQPDQIRFLSVVFGSMLIGVAGSYLSLVEVNTFQPDLTGGRGWIALMAMILGQWKPLGTLGAALLFGTAGALAFRIPAFHLPIPALAPSMLPYILALIALAASGRSTPPADDGKPFVREEL